MPTAQETKRQRQIMAEIAKLGFCLPGSLVARSSRCGHPNCRCHRDPELLHGPYPSWTRKVRGKTVTRNLSATQAERYQPWFDNAKRLRELVGELEALSTKILVQAEGWDGSEPVSGGSTSLTSLTCLSYCWILVRHKPDGRQIPCVSHR